MGDIKPQQKRQIYGARRAAFKTAISFDTAVRIT